MLSAEVQVQLSFAAVLDFEEKVRLVRKGGLEAIGRRVGQRLRKGVRDDRDNRVVHVLSGVSAAMSVGRAYRPPSSSKK